MFALLPKRLSNLNLKKQQFNNQKGDIQTPTLVIWEHSQLKGISLSASAHYLKDFNFAIHVRG